MSSGSEEGSYSRLIDLCITQLLRVIKKKEKKATHDVPRRARI